MDAHQVLVTKIRQAEGSRSENLLSILDEHRAHIQSCPICQEVVRALSAAVLGDAYLDALSDYHLEMVGEFPEPVQQPVFDLSFLTPPAWKRDEPVWTANLTRHVLRLSASLQLEYSQDGGLRPVDLPSFMKDHTRISPVVATRSGESQTAKALFILPIEDGLQIQMQLEGQEDFYHLGLIFTTASGRPPKAIQVRLKGPVNLLAFSDSQGKTIFRDLPLGSYWVEVSLHHVRAEDQKTETIWLIPITFERR